MNNKGSKPRALVVLALTSCCIGAAQAQQQGLPSSSLGNWSHLAMPAGATDAYAADINNAGQVVGSMVIGGERTSFFYSGGRMREIALLGVRNGSANAINENGWAVGGTHWSAVSTVIAYNYRSDGSVGAITPATAAYSFATHINNHGEALGTYYTQPPSSPGAVQRAFFYSEGRQQYLGWGGYTVATGLNDSGQVSGYGRMPGSDTLHAFRWQNGTTTELGTLGGSYATTQDINEAGQIIGTSALAGPAGAEPTHAFLWDNGRMSDLGTLGGSNSTALDLNDAGDVVGSSLIGDGNTQHAFLYRDGAMHDLGTFGGANSVALGTNELGDVVGVADLAQNDPLGRPIEHAFLYRNGTMIDLSASLAASFNDITYIDPYSVLTSDVGHVLLYGITASGLRGVFMLTPIPEPATAALLLAGLLVLGAGALRRSPRRCRPAF